MEIYYTALYSGIRSTRQKYSTNVCERKLISIAMRLYCEKKYISQSQINIVVRENLISIVKQCHCIGKEYFIDQANNSHIFLEFQNSIENGLIADLFPK